MSSIDDPNSSIFEKRQIRIHMTQPAYVSRSISNWRGFYFSCCHKTWHQNSFYITDISIWIRHCNGISKAFSGKDRYNNWTTAHALSHDHVVPCFLKEKLQTKMPISSNLDYSATCSSAVLCFVDCWSWCIYEWERADTTQSLFLFAQFIYRSTWSKKEMMWS